MFVAAPNDSFTGFHSVENRKWKTPNLPMAREDSRTSTQNTPMMMNMIDRDASPVSREKPRYTGKPAAFLRGFRAVYLGLLVNCLILGWVTKAMVSIISTSLGITDAKALALCV